VRLYRGFLFYVVAVLIFKNLEIIVDGGNRKHKKRSIDRIKCKECSSFYYVNFYLCGACLEFYLKPKVLMFLIYRLKKKL